MDEQSPGTLPTVRASGDRLGSWKEIATYLNRDVTTVQRWEKREGMPVHRHLHDRMGSVYAYRAELDAWVSGRNLRAAQERENATLDDTPAQPPTPFSVPSVQVESVGGSRNRLQTVQAGKVPTRLLSDTAEAADTQVGLGASSKSGTLKLRWLLLATCLILIAVIGIWIRHRRQQTQPPIHSLAVMPLKNLSGDPAQEYFADGMTEEVIGRLSTIRGLRVISRTSVMRFKDTHLSAPEIAKTLAVDAFVEGSVIREGNRVRVHAQLIRASTDEHLWSEAYDRELRDVLALQSDVAQAIARRVEVTLTGEEQKRLAAVRPVTPDVYENYLKGRFALSKGNKKANVEESIGYFNEAIRKDPTFAPGYLGLAHAYSYLGTVFIGGVPKEERPKAIVAARKALELDPELVEAHVELANMLQTQWHWAEAEVEYRRALDLRPNDATAHSGLAWWLVCQGRVEEAVATRRHGRELDPLAVSGSDVAWDLFYARRYDDAVQELRSVLAVKPDDAYALWILGFALIANHHPQEAIAVLEKGASASDGSPALIGLLIHAYAQAGRRAEALHLLEDLKQRKQTGYVPAAAFVKAYLGLGEYEQAFFWLDEAYKEQSNILQLLKVHPIFDPVRNDPRFTDLMRRVGLE